jgi:hypothetical protein
MITIARTPIHVFNSVEKKPQSAPRHKSSRHWRQHSMERVDMMSDRIRDLEKQVSQSEAANAKLKRLAQWNLRSTSSALKDVEEMLVILEDVYGEDATPKSE